MKNTRRTANLLITLLAILSVFITFSCSGLFTSLKTNPNTGTLTIELPQKHSREAGYTADYIDHYEISIYSEDTGEAAVFNKTITEGTYSVELESGSYYVTIPGIIKNTGGQKQFYFLRAEKPHNRFRKRNCS